MMQFIRFTRPGGHPQFGVKEDTMIYPLNEFPAGEPSLVDIGSASYRETVARARRRGDVSAIPEADVRLLAPVPKPGKIVCVGLNYMDHAEEQEETPP